MAEAPTLIENNTTPDQKNLKKHPTKETFAHLRHLIKERMPEARRAFDKSGTTPTPRELINSAGDKLKQEMESDYDVLTGLLNKNGYEKQVKKALEKARIGNLPMAVAVVDLDDLKITNDTFGHIKGDFLLKNAADALKAVSRDTDIIARVGGDEFHVLLENTTPELASAWKQRFNDELSARKIRASTGISEVDLSDIEGSIETADSQMYVEKRQKKHKPGKITQALTRVRKIFKRAA